MSCSLPDLLDPWRAVDDHSVITGRLPLSSLPRLRELLLDTAGDITFRLAFSRDEDLRALVHCEVAANLRLGCQRCLEVLDHAVASSTVLALISGMDEERQLPERYDPLPVSERLMRPRDLIEDELLLALPQIPVHDRGVCRARVLRSEKGETGANRESPFAVLAELRRGTRHNQ